MTITELEAWARAKGVLLYATFDQGERRILQFGMHPAQKMEEATAQIVAEFRQAEGRDPSRHELSAMTRMLAVGCMDGANAGPDKMIV